MVAGVYAINSYNDLNVGQKSNTFADMPSYNVAEPNQKAEVDTFTSTTKEENGTQKLEKNKGFLNKIKHFFTGKDYYKTSSGVKITTDKNTGSVYEAADGSVYADGLQNAKIKGTKNDDCIVVSGSSVKSVNGKKGDDTIYFENSNVEKIKGGNGQDYIEVYNSYVKDINGGRKDDTISTINSRVGKLNGQWGKDVVTTQGGFVEKIKSTFRDTVEIHNNPLNQNPDTEYAF